jgi:hypothetical protein
MLKKLTSVKMVFINVIALAIAVAASFGFRCPAQGCPACKALGQ